MAKPPLGPVAAVRAFLEKRREALYEKRLPRAKLIDQLEAKGINRATASSTVAKWMRENSMTFGGITPAMLRKIDAHKTAKAARERAAPN